MKRAVTLLSLFISTALAQPQATPQFEVSDVQPSPHTNQPNVRGPFFAGGRYELRFATMVDLIAQAYNIDPEKVYGGPSWLEMDRFDVFAKVSGPSNAESRRKMLQSLLADRFQLVTHMDRKPMAAWALTAGKHSGLKPASDDSKSGCDFKVENAPNGPPANGAPIQLPTIVWTCANTSMEAFAAGMPNIPAAGQFLGNLLVVDHTGLAGNFDFTLRFTPKLPAGIQTVGENVPFPEALEKQLGLKLETATAPIPVIVVDSVNRKPAPNSPEAMKSFPPLPTEFEVASLKPTDPNARPDASRPDIRNGRIYLPRLSVKNLIAIAWDINGNDLIANAPGWTDNDRYDILAKAPDGVAIGDLTPSRNVIPVNIDALRPMLRSLIVDRFKLKVHTENRPVNAYTLVAVKPKLQKADPNERTKWKEGASTDTKGKNANAALGRLVVCQNVTMSQFAEMLPGIAPGYLGTTVTDATGLEGGYDFTFSFSPVGAVTLSQNARPNTDNGGEASDPTGAMSLFDAMTRQLGLKLEQQKRPYPVLVIDSIERKPTEN